MVDVIPTSPVGGFATAEAPKRVDVGVFARSYQDLPGLGPGLQALGAGLDDLAVSAAKEKATEDLRNPQLGADGLPRAPQNSFLLGNAGKAYQHAVEAGSLAKISNTIGPTLAEMRVKFADNPQQFAAAYEAYANKLKEQYPGALGLDAYQRVMQSGAGHYSSLVGEEANRNIQNSVQALTTQIDQSQNQLRAMAREGLTGSEDFKKISSQVDAWYDQLGANKLFGYSAEKIATEKQRMTETLQGEAVVGSVDKIFAADGATAARKALEDQIVRNTGSHLSDQDRARLRSWGEARVSYLEGQNATKISALKTTVDSALPLIRSGKMTDAQVDGLIDNARNLGGAELASQLVAARTVARAAAPTANLAPGAQAAIAGKSNTGPVGGFDAAVNRTFGFEGGMNPSDTNGTPSNMGINAKANPDVDVANLTKEQARQIYKERYWDAIGADKMDPKLAHVAFDTAVIAGTGRANAMIAAAGGDPSKLMDLREKFQAGLLASDPKRYGKYAEAWATRNQGLRADIGASANGIPFTQDQIKANPYLMSEWVQRIASDVKVQEKYATTIGAGIENGLKANLAPDAPTLASYLQIAQQNPEAFGDQAQRILTQIKGMDIARSAGDVPPSTGQAVIDRAMSMANGGSIMQQQVALAAKSHFEQDAKELAATPGYSAARRGWISQEPMPLDFKSQQGLNAAMMQRDVMATAIASHTGNQSQSALQPADLEQVKSVMDNGTTAQKAGLIASLGQLSKPTLDATLKQLAGNDATLPLAMAAKVAMDNPEAAKMILEGQALLKSDPKLGADKDLREMQWNKTLPIADVKDPQIRTAIGNSVNAVYASMSAQANDLSGVFKKDRYDAAVKAVTGGVIDFRGSKVFAPWYGATDGQFAGAIQKLTPDDLRGAMATDGTPFPPSMLKPSLSDVLPGRGYRLESVGNGKYLIFAGDDSARRYIMRDKLDARDPGGPFVLDLGSKKSPDQYAAPSLMGGPPPSAVLTKDQIWGGGTMQPQDKTKPLPVSSEIGS